MKKIILQENKEKTICLERRNAQCNFCGEHDKDCVKALLGLSSKKKFLTPITDYGYFSKDYIFKPNMFFREDTYLFSEKPRYCEFIKGKKEVEIGAEDSADICTDCILELAKLFK